jgi:hypothetical protein
MAKISTKEDGRPGFYWYPKDWMGAADVGLCSYAARGLWMELLNLMFLSPKRGYLLLPNNNKPDNKMITKLCRGDSVEETEKLLKELEQNNVYSKTEDGCIYCRVMKDRSEKEEQIKQARAEAGKVGMSKRWHNKSITRKNNKTITKDFPPASPRAENAKEKESICFDVVNAFEDIWETYPKTLGKKKALKHFISSVKSEVDFENIKTALANYKASIIGKEVQYIQHGSTWFNNWRDWIDYKPEQNNGKTENNSRILS